MCLLIIAHQVSPDYPLLVAANRDEFHGRPTATSDFWAEHPQLLAGRDMQAGGTWMGITRNGRFAAVTNYRDPAHTAPAPRSRGELPVGYLLGSSSPLAFLNELASGAAEYAGFNLLVGDQNSLWYFTNSDRLDPQMLSPGIYGLSNASLDTPWPKVEMGKARLRALLESAPVSHETLSTVVGNRQQAESAALNKSGLRGAMDPILSAQFIVTDTYGTRSSTTLWISAGHEAGWLEQRFDELGVLRESQKKEFELVTA